MTEKKVLGVPPGQCDKISSTLETMDSISSIAYHQLFFGRFFLCKINSLLVAVASAYSRQIQNNIIQSDLEFIHINPQFIPVITKVQSRKIWSLFYQIRSSFSSDLEFLYSSQIQSLLSLSDLEFISARLEFIPLRSRVYQPQLCNLFRKQHFGDNLKVCTYTPNLLCFHRYFEILQ